MRKNQTRLIIGSLISLVLLAWVIQSTDWDEFILRLQEADPLMLFAAFLMVIIGVMVRAWRWNIMVEPEDPDASWLSLFDAINLGYLANHLLPARLGDLLRAFLASEWTNAPFSFTLSTTIVERVLDTLFVVIMLFAVLPFLPVPAAAAQLGLIVGAALFLVGIIA